MKNEWIAKTLEFQFSIYKPLLHILFPLNFQIRLTYELGGIIPIYQISRPSLAPSHIENSVPSISMSILKLNVMRAPEMASIFGIWGLKISEPSASKITFSIDILMSYLS